MKEMQSRREFLKQGAALAALSAVSPSLLAAEGATRPKAPAGKSGNVLAVVQLSGGNDGLNTIVPFGDPHYFDQRPKLVVPGESVLAINQEVGFHPNAGPLLRLFDEGRVAILQGVGYPAPDRSHFRAMDIWHTAEPETLSDSGWLGRAIKQIDPDGDEPLAAINFGKGVPKAFQLEGVVAPSVTNLDSYGVFSAIRDPASRQRATEMFTRIYAGKADSPHARRIHETGVKAAEVAERLRGLGADYQPAVEYPAQNPLAADLQQAARVHLSRGHTRILYTQIGGFDTHANQSDAHASLVKRFSEAIEAFYSDLKAQNQSSNVIVLVFSEFGRRVRENASLGTDHGAAGPVFVIGDAVKGGLYGERHPSLTDLDRGDLRFAVDFRSVYSTILERWLGLDSAPVLGRAFPHMAFV